jgi:large subunit ribosomal protein L24
MATQTATTLHVKKGDTVQIITGKDRGVTGKVILTLPKEGRVIVEGVNRVKKHTRVTTNQRGAQSGGIVTQEAPIHASNVMVVCPGCGKASRVGHRKDDEGRTVRVCKRCDSDI